MSRNPVLVLIGLVASTGCSMESSSTDTATTSEALTEARASADDARATAEACFATFEDCVTADGADVDACRAALRECLPEDAHPGPRCGPPRGRGPGHPHGPHGPHGEGVGAPRPAAPPGSDEGARRVREDVGPAGGGEGGESCDGDAPRPARVAGEEPPFCRSVPLPPPAAVVACRETLGTCLEGASDPAGHEACFEAHHACVRDAFEAARASFEALAE